MKWTIETLANGWLVYTDDGENLARPMAFSVDESNSFGDDTQEVEAFANMLRFLTDELGPSTSRYSKARIYIQIQPGDKYEEA